MRVLVGTFLTGIFCVATALGVVTWLTTSDGGTKRRPDRPRVSEPDARASAAGRNSPGSADERGQRAELEIIRDEFEDGGDGTASPVHGPDPRPGSLEELREAVRGRGRRGIAALWAKYDDLRLGSPPTQQQAIERVLLQKSIGLLYMYEGKFAEASAWIEKAPGRQPGAGRSRRRSGTD